MSFSLAVSGSKYSTSSEWLWSTFTHADKKRANKRKFAPVPIKFVSFEAMILNIKTRNSWMAQLNWKENKTKPKWMSQRQIRTEQKWQLKLLINKIFMLLFAWDNVQYPKNRQIERETERASSRKRWKMLTK